MLFIILGQYDYNDMQKVNRYLAPLFVVSYISLVGYGLVNIFLAIMTQSYDRLRSMYFDDYESLERQRRQEHAKGTGQPMETMGKKYRGQRGGGGRHRAAQRGHMALTPWEAIVRLVPICKNIKRQADEWYSGEVQERSYF